LEGVVLEFTGDGDVVEVLERGWGDFYTVWDLVDVVVVIVGIVVVINVVIIIVRNWKIRHFLLLKICFLFKNIFFYNF